MLKITSHEFLLAGVRKIAQYTMNGGSKWKTKLHLARLRRKVWTMSPGSRVRCRDYAIRINDGPNFYTLYKDIFIRGIYHFEARRPDPLILDCGSNIGMSVVYFKMVYPQARVICFEPDPVIFPYLQENIQRNNLADVELIQAALAGKAGALSFYSDGKFGSCIASNMPGRLPEGWVQYQIPCVRLRDYIKEPVDFLKMNIEGAEWEVLADSEDHLRQVREMVIEYHHMPGLPRTLHDILELLHRQGFEYLINDFDSETNGEVQTPFSLTPKTRYFLLIYAIRFTS